MTREGYLFQLRVNLIANICLMDQAVSMLTFLYGIHITVTSSRILNCSYLYLFKIFEFESEFEYSSSNSNSNMCFFLILLNIYQY